MKTDIFVQGVDMQLDSNLMQNELICFGYWAECGKSPRGNECNYKEECFESWFDAGGRLGLEGILKGTEKRYDE